MQTYKMDVEDKMVSVVGEAKQSFIEAKAQSLSDVELESLKKQAWKCVTNLEDSNDGDGQDLELRFTMPLDEFMELAPKAALEAASIPHKFPTVYIYLRHEETRRIGRVAFRDADPIAGRYKAGDSRAIREMKDAIVWH
jgi:hypothetical protein